MSAPDHQKTLKVALLIVAAGLALFLLVRAALVQELTSILSLVALFAAITTYLQLASHHARRQLRYERSQREAAQATNKAKTRFLASMSKELRTPLNVILGFAQIQRNQLPADAQPAQTKNSEETLAAGWQLINLIDDILDISRVEEGKLSLNVESCKLSEIASHASSLVMEDAALHSIELNVEDSPLLVDADYTRLKQVLVKLFTNAIRYNRPGGKVSFSAQSAADGRVECRITDTGVGIAAADWETIFEPFARLEYSEREKISGTGMGLALTRFLVEAMGGEVALVSSDEQGSTFVLTLRAPEAMAATEAISRDQFSATTTTRRGVQPGPIARPLLVIYVEDHLASQELVKAILDPMENVTLLTAANTEAGIELARKHTPDLMLMDINLHGHGMDGVSAAREMKASADLSDIPLVAVSADAIESAIEEAIGAGFVRYLTKPLDIEELWKVIHQVASKSGLPSP